MVWRLDRLGRSLPHLLAIANDLQDRGVELRSLTEVIDTTTPGGRLIFHVFGAVAEFERAIAAERTAAGVAAARANGRHPGRPGLAADTIAAAQALDQGWHPPRPDRPHPGHLSVQRLPQPRHAQRKKSARQWNGSARQCREIGMTTMSSEDTTTDFTSDNYDDPRRDVLLSPSEELAGPDRYPRMWNMSAGMAFLG